MSRELFRPNRASRISHIGLLGLAAFISIMLAIGIVAGAAWSIPKTNDEASTITVKAISSELEVIDQFGVTHRIEKGAKQAFRGSAPDFITIKGEIDSKGPVNISILSVDGQSLENPSLFENGPWFRDVTFTGIDKCVEASMVSTSKSRAMLAGSPSGATRAAPSEDQPEVGDIFTGNCNVGMVDQNGSDGSVNSVICKATSGILTEFTGIRCYCADHSAAAPYVGQLFTYTYTITAVNKRTGSVEGHFYATSINNPTDGVTTDSSGRLQGYQRLSVYAEITRDYTGYLRLKKISAIPSITTSNSLYSLVGATYRLYDDRECTIESGYDDIVTAEDDYVQTDAIAAGFYYIKEIKAPKGYKLSSKVHRVEVVPSETVDIGDIINGKTVVKDDPRHNPSKFILAKLDNDSEKCQAQGDATLKGARYKVEYYDGQYLSIQSAEESGSPKKQWTFETDSNGKINMCNEDYLISGTLYKDDDGDIVYPLGTYIIHETKASEGYLLSDEKVRVRIMKDPDSDETIFKGNVVKGNTIEGAGSAYDIYENVVLVKENPIKGSLDVAKLDAETGSSPQGDGELAKTTFTLKNVSKNAIIYDGKSVNPNKTICTIEIPEGGSKAALAKRCLPYGTYSIQETKAGNGYNIDNGTVQTFKITADGQIEHFTNDNAYVNTIKKGFAYVTKRNKLADDGLAQGDATLEGTEFEIHNRSINAISYEGRIIQKDGLIAAIATDAAGNCPKVKLPYGTYSIRETKASEGFLLTDSATRTFQIRKDGEQIDLAFANDPIRGSLQLEKRDLETGELSPLGGATLEGTRFEITNRSKAKVVLAGKTFLPNEVCAVIYTGKDGIAQIGEKTLPYGTYSLKETSPSEGYLLTDKEPRTFTIRHDGEIAFYGKSEQANLARKGDAFYNQVMREDVSFVKIRGDSSEHLANIPFEIVCSSTGERHVIVTDENGEARTESSWNPHTRNTNANDSCTEENIDRYAGVWWELAHNGSKAPVKDELCALIYGDYTIRELPVSGNLGLDLVEFDFSVKRNGYNINLGTIENNPPSIKQEPSISTNASDAKDGDKVAYASSSCKLRDQINYINLETGINYTIHATLLDAETLEAIQGAEAYKDFTASSTFGSIVIEIECDTLKVAGKEVVFYEELLLDGKKICEHKDSEDASQIVYIESPEVETYAHDAHDGDKSVSIDENSCIIDEVKIERLEPKVSYQLYGIVMDSSTNLPAIVNKSEDEEPSLEEISVFWNGLLNLLGAEESVEESMYSCEIDYGHKIDKQAIKEYLEENSAVANALDIVSKEFVAKSASMTTTFEYRVASKKLEGKHVIFDLLLNDDIVVATHADTSNSDQSFEIVRPRISTTATDGSDGDHNVLSSKSAEIIDVVEYSGLMAGDEYEVFGTLMNRATSNALCINDKTVKSSTKFVPNTPNGSVEVRFTFDATDIEKGTDLVVFERLRKNGKDIAEHEDIEDESQTVTIDKLPPTDLFFETPEDVPEESSGTPTETTVDTPTSETPDTPITTITRNSTIPTGGVYYKTGYIPKDSPIAMFILLAIGGTSYIVYKRKKSLKVSRK